MIYAALILVGLLALSRAVDVWVKSRCAKHGHGPWVEVFGGRACTVCGTIEEC